MSRRGHLRLVDTEAPPDEPTDGEAASARLRTAADLVDSGNAGDVCSVLVVLLDRDGRAGAGYAVRGTHAADDLDDLVTAGAAYVASLGRLAGPASNEAATLAVTAARAARFEARHRPRRP